MRKDLGYKRNREGEKREGKITGGREKRGRLIQGKIKFSLFSLLFLTGQLMFFLSLPFFF